MPDGLNGGTHPDGLGERKRTPSPAEFELPPTEEEQVAGLDQRSPPQGEPRTEDPAEKHKLKDIQWNWRDGGYWADKEIPDRDWILPGLIPQRQTTGLYGVGGVNKTDFLLQLAMATSMGLPFIGYQTVKAPVVALFCEDDEEEIARRGQRIAHFYGLDIGDFYNFHYVSLVGYDLPYFLTFNNGKGTPGLALRKADLQVVTKEAKLLILDTAPHFFAGNDISRLEVSTFLRKLDAISLARECAVLFAAHPSASGVKSGRMTSGSTHWEGGVRARLALTRPEADDEVGKPPSDTRDRTLTLWKSNYAPPGKTVDLCWDKGIFTTGALDPEKAKARGPGRSAACEEKFMELLRAVVAQGGYVNDSVSHPARYAPAVFSGRPDGKLYSKPEYHRAMTRLLAANRLRYETKRDRIHLVENTTMDGRNTTPDLRGGVPDVDTAWPEANN